MNKSVELNKAEPPILLQKNSSCYIYNTDVFQPLLKFKGLKQQDVEANLNSNSNIKYTMPVFWFMKSPDLDDGKEWHLNYYAEYKIPGGENGYKSKLGFRSVHNVNGHKKLVRTSELMVMVSVHQMESSQFEKFAADIKNYDSETQIKMLEEAGYKKFTVQDGEDRNCSNSWMNAESPYTICGALDFYVDESLKRVCFSAEYYCEPHNYGKKDKDGQYISTRSEYINPAHMPYILKFPENEELNSVIILNENAEMKYNGDSKDESPFHWLKNKNPLTFYCEPGAKVATDILSKCKDEGKYPEFCNATIVFMSPKLVAEYQKNLDDVDNYREMKEFIKSYEEKKDYFSFELSDCSNQRIEQLSHAQTDFSDTWSYFVGFIKAIVFKEKNDVNDVEHTNESVDENEIGKLDDKNQIESRFEDENRMLTQNSGVDNSNKQTGNIVHGLPLVESDNKNHKENIELISDNEKKENEIEKTGDINEKRLKNENETATQNPIMNQKKENKIEIKPTDEPEENLSSFMQYLKNHWPRIFKFINAICNFFSNLKDKFKNDNKIDLGDAINRQWKTNSLLGKTLAFSSQKDMPKNMENQSVDNEPQQK